MIWQGRSPNAVAERYWTVDMDDGRFAAKNAFWRPKGTGVRRKSITTRKHGDDEAVRANDSDSACLLDESIHLEGAIEKCARIQFNTCVSTDTQFVRTCQSQIKVYTCTTSTSQVSARTISVLVVVSALHCCHSCITTSGNNSRP